MPTSETYYQFPLSMLAYAKNTGDRLSAIVDLCCHDVGERVAVQIEGGEQDYDAETLIARRPAEDMPGGYDADNAEHVNLVLGMVTLGVIKGNTAHMLASAKKAATFNAAMAGRFGAFPLVRLRGDLLWETIKNSMSYRDMAVLCAVFSVVGAKAGPVRITRETIIARAMGYKRPQDMTETELNARTDKAKPLTADQVRWTLDRMEARSLFARVQVSRRVTVFSHRLDRKALAEAAAKHFGRPDVLRVNRANDRELQERIKRERHSIKVGTGEKSPLNPHTVPTRVPTGVPTRVPTLIKAFNRTLQQKPGTETCNKRSGERMAFIQTSGEQQHIAEGQP